MAFADLFKNVLAPKFHPIVSDSSVVFGITSPLLDNDSNDVNLVAESNAAIGDTYLTVTDPSGVRGVVNVGHVFTVNGSSYSVTKRTQAKNNNIELRIGIPGLLSAVSAGDSVEFSTGQITVQNSALVSLTKFKPLTQADVETLPAFGISYTTFDDLGGLAPIPIKGWTCNRLGFSGYVLRVDQNIGSLTVWVGTEKARAS